MKAHKGEIDDIRTTISSLTIFPYGDDRVEMPQWDEMNATTSCDWIIENSLHSKMTWKMHRSKKYKYQDMVLRYDAFRIVSNNLLELF